MNNISRLLSCFKALSRLDSILLAVATVATGVAGYSAYGSYAQTSEITALHSQIASLESQYTKMSSENSLYQDTAETYRQNLKEAKLQAASLDAKVQSMERDAEAYREVLLKASQQFDDYERRIKGLDGVARDAIKALEEEIASNNVQQSAPVTYQYSAPVTTPQYSVSNESKRAGIDSEIYSISSKIASLRASYNAAKGGLQSQYDSYSAQAQQAYINYMMLERDLGDTETEQHQIRLAKENQQQYANKAADVKEQIDRLTEQYNSDVAELEEYKAKLQKQLN